MAIQIDGWARIRKDEDDIEFTAQSHQTRLIVRVAKRDVESLASLQSATREQLERFADENSAALKTIAEEHLDRVGQHMPPSFFEFPITLDDLRRHHTALSLRAFGR
jgi:hypothetical protein